MRIIGRMAMLAGAMVSLLAFIAGTAGALTSIELQPGGNLRASFRELTLRSEVGNLICNVTLNATLRAGAIQKRVGNTVGGVIESLASNGPETCRESIFGGGIRVGITAERNAPIALTYVSFLGTLPNIRGILIEAARSRFTIESAITGLCRYEGPVGVLIPFNGGNPNVSTGTIRFLEERAVRQIEGGGLCPGRGTFRGEGAIEPQQTIRLL